VQQELFKRPPPPSPVTQSILLRRVADCRDSESFKQLFECFSSPLRRYFIRRGCSFATAEELSQDTLMTVWRKASLYRSELGTVSAWIFVMARNLRIDQLRRECPWFEVDPQLVDAIPSDDVAADDQIIQQQQSALLVRAVGQLTFNQRQVVTLSSSQGLSHSKISQHLCLPLGTVKSRTRLGHAKLRAALDHLRQTDPTAKRGLP
jgi:RNA polymerase sigma-70 factor, ECF subfamily